MMIMMMVMVMVMRMMMMIDGWIFVGYVTPAAAAGYRGRWLPWQSFPTDGHGV